MLLTLDLEEEASAGDGAVGLKPDDQGPSPGGEGLGRALGPTELLVVHAGHPLDSQEVTGATGRGLNVVLVQSQLEDVSRVGLQ